MISTCSCGTTQLQISSGNKMFRKVTPLVAWKEFACWRFALFDPMRGKLLGHMEDFKELISYQEYNKAWIHCDNLAITALLDTKWIPLLHVVCVSSKSSIRFRKKPMWLCGCNLVRDGDFVFVYEFGVDFSKWRTFCGPVIRKIGGYMANASDQTCWKKMDRRTCLLWYIEDPPFSWYKLVYVDNVNLGHQWSPHFSTSEFLSSPWYLDPSHKFHHRYGTLDFLKQIQVDHHFFFEWAALMIDPCTQLPPFFIAHTRDFPAIYFPGVHYQEMTSPKYSTSCSYSKSLIAVIDLKTKEGGKAKKGRTRGKKTITDNKLGLKRTSRANFWGERGGPLNGKWYLNREMWPINVKGCWNSEILDGDGAQ